MDRIQNNIVDLPMFVRYIDDLVSEIGRNTGTSPLCSHPEMEPWSRLSETIRTHIITECITKEQRTNAQNVHVAAWICIIGEVEDGRSGTRSPQTVSECYYELIQQHQEDIATVRAHWERENSVNQSAWHR